MHDYRGLVCVQFRESWDEWEWGRRGLVRVSAKLKDEGMCCIFMLSERWNYWMSCARISMCFLLRGVFPG